MKSGFFTFFLILASFGVNGQEDPPEFGNVSLAEMTMSTYARDTSAAAIILFDKGETSLNMTGVQSVKGLYNGSRTIYTRHIRIKFFKKQAFQEWGNVHLLIYRNLRSRIRAASYFLENGKIVKSELGNSAIFRTKEGKFLEKVSFAFPNLKEGAVIEYSYMLNYLGTDFPSWSFQSSIPTVWSGYSINFDRFVKSDILGNLNISKWSKKMGEYQQWVAKDAPAFEEEPFMLPRGIYRSTIHLWPLDFSWAWVNYRLLYSDYFGSVLKNPITVNPTALTAGLTDAKQKIKAITNYVKENIAWDGTEDFYADDPKVVFERKKGSSGDINLILGNMLLKAGLDLRMVLITTRGNGFILEKIPSLSQFNYVICRVYLADGSSILVDATEKNLPFDVLPERCLNYKGLMIDFGSGGFISINSKTKAKTSVKADLQLGAAGELSGKVVVLNEGYEALKARNEYRNKGKEDYQKAVEAQTSWQIEKSEIKNLEDIDKPVTEIYDVLIKNKSTIAGDLIYLNPYVALKQEKNPFVLEKREYPIDLGTLQERALICNITLPNGYAVDELPESKTIRFQDDGAKCAFNITQIGNLLTVTCSLQINKSLFDQAEYLSLRDFYSRLVAKMDEPIVLKKIK